MNAVVLIGIAFTLTAPRPKDAPKAPPPIVGTWEVSTLQSDGRDKRLDLLFVWEFTEDGRWLIRTGGKENPGDRQYTINAKASPATIDLIGVENEKPSEGIFRVEGDTLTLCLNPGKRDRPTEFSAGAGSPYFLYTFKRMKKD